jgi:hypothetical protein
MSESEEHPPGFYWHYHREGLIEFCRDYHGHVNFIRTEKAVDEVSVRLRLFKPVRGTLPEAVVQAGQAYAQARKVYDQAAQVCNQAGRVYAQAGQACNQARLVYNLAGQACKQAEEAYDQAGQALDQAWQAFNRALQDNMPAIEALHQQECPNCPWDGTTIFPKA